MRFERIERQFPNIGSSTVLDSLESACEFVVGGAQRAFGIDTKMAGSNTLDEAVNFSSEVGPVSRVLADAPEEKRRAAIGAIRETLKAYDDGSGIALSAACWIVTARNPA